MYQKARLRYAFDMETSQEDCIFCKIIRKDVPAPIVYEDEHTFAFLDARPNNFGHTLVIPKKHFRNIFDVDVNSLEKLMPVAQKISIALKNSGLAEGVHLLVNNESPAHQVVFHMHLHIIPRFSADTFDLGFRPHRDYAPNQELELIEKIQNHLPKD